MSDPIRLARRAALVVSIAWAALACSPPRVHAATGPSGVNLGWGQCLADGGFANRTFACDTNTGSETLVGSFVTGSDLPAVDGVEIVLELQAATATLPAWWDFKNVGSCRVDALTLSPWTTGTNCPDWSTPQVAGGIGAYQVGTVLPNRARLLMVLAVPPSDARSLAGDTEYAAFGLAISHERTNGAGACAGCLVPVCLVLTRLGVHQSASSQMLQLQNPLVSDYVLWQGGAIGGLGCPGAVPARRSTWGGVKSLYR